MIQSSLGQLDWWELEQTVGGELDAAGYAATYLVSGIATFDQVCAILALRCKAVEQYASMVLPCPDVRVGMYC